MADPISIGAAVGWGVTAAGWLLSPIISRLLNKAFAHLDYNAVEKLKMLDIQVLQLQRVMEVVDESTYRVHLEPLLNKLKSALYEAEDILDNFEYQSLREPIEAAKDSEMDSLRKKLRSVSLMNYTVKYLASGISKLHLEKSLKKIESAISDACKVLKQLNFPGVSNDKWKRAVPSSSRNAGITVGPLQVIGRDQDRDKIIAMLHEKEDQCQANTACGTGYSVIGIHGIAGSGKSTLARFVYDHEKRHKQEEMEGLFDIVMWIHVSQKFDLYSIFMDMFEEATKGAVEKECHPLKKNEVKECPKFHSLNILKESLEEKLCGKRILLVLDDVWYSIRNSEDREQLQKLISPLHVGKAGSRILVTSQTEAALVTLGAVKERCIPIAELDDEVFLQMFKHYALRDARVGDNDRRILEMIAEDIAKKLKRSPLAARTVGSRLRERQTVEFWRSEKDRDLLSDTMGALRWSYQYLDEQVRRCFAYCSIFPRGHHLKRDELVKLWVAEGFINTSEPEQEMEDVAKNYFDELLSASFLQLGGKERSQESYNCGSEVDYFTIHDLLCDLAVEVAGRDCFRIEKGFTGEVPQDVRYLFVETYDSKMLTEKISGLKNLRTLIIHPKIQLNSTEGEAFARMFDMLMRLRKLRVLKLGFNGMDLTKFVIGLTDSIGQLTHLRYFAFCMTQHMKLTVPDVFTRLYHMQVVDFGDCTELVFSNGEDMNMMNLINLRCVITKAYLVFPNVGRLTWLQMLPFFVILKEQGYESHQLKHLNKLQELNVHGLENIQSKEEALDVNLAGKEKLIKLGLWWANGSCSPEVQAEVLQGLCPSKYLEKLSIHEYQGMKLPKWMMSEHNGGPKNLKELVLARWREPDLALDLRAFTHLHLLHLWECSWDALPGMEHLTSLKKLVIYDCKNMRLLGTLPKSLEEFTVWGCIPEFERLCNDYWSRLHQRLSTSWEVGALVLRTDI